MLFMKKILIIAGILCLTTALLNQELQHVSTVVNIEVPVRVFQGDSFVDTLTKDDFEVFEDGVVQDLEAVYLIKNNAIQRSEESTPLNPETSRQFYFFFEVTEPTERMESALNHFFQNVFTARDNLTVVTPRQSYFLKRESLDKMSKAEIAHQLKLILRRDAWIGNSEYREIMREITMLVRSAQVEDFPDLNMLDGFRYIEIDLTGPERLEIARDRLESLRTVNQARLLEFARHLKEKEGQKHVFLFYQKEFIPEITAHGFEKAMNVLMPVEQFKILSFYGYFFRDISFDIDKVKQAYSDASITINFLFFTKPAEHVSGIRMMEHSEDFFSAFSAMSEATGGITTSSGNPEFLFRKASESAENYYLLYYSVKDYAADGKFKNITVKLKDRGFTISHRTGYFAN
jgi:hypothetical protein